MAKVRFVWLRIEFFDGRVGGSVDIEQKYNSSCENELKIRDF